MVGMTGGNVYSKAAKKIVLSYSVQNSTQTIAPLERKIRGEYPS
jgi:hypothetical protein